MKKFLLRCHPIALCAMLALLLSVCTNAAGAPSEPPELVQARTRLLDLYNRKLDDSDDQVKNTKLEIARLEYLAAHSPARGEDVAQLVSVDFPGGPASALIAAIAKSSGSSGFNVIGEKADLAIELPPFAVRNADVSSLAAALNALLQPRGYNFSTNARLLPGQTPVFTLRKLYGYEAANLAAQENRLSQFQSFQLEAYLGDQKIDDIVGAVRAAWELDPAHKPDALHVKFHPATSILLVSGPDDAIRITTQVIQALKRAQPRIPPPAPNK